MIAQLFIILAGIFATIVVVSFFLPSKIVFERSLTIQADIKSVFSYVNDLTYWQTWSAWSKFNDHSIICTFNAKHTGKGAVMHWKGKKLGKGKMELTGSKPNKNLESELYFNNSGFRIFYQFIFTELADGTHVQWIASGKMRRFGIAKWIALMLPRWMGRDMEIGLQLLKQLAENK
ncbi:MAG: SRPBCC family protein [Chitinophagales bacterium]